MGDGTKIEWTDSTWNPVVGCTHVSPGCDFCYAARQASGRLKTTPTYAGLAEDGKFNGTVRLLPDRLDQPLRWARPRRIFVNSMSDLFHEGIPDQFIAEVFATMAFAGQHTFQVLTKRHGRLRSLLNDPDFRADVDSAGGKILATLRPPARPRYIDLDRGGVVWPIPNVWIGVSVEDQKWAEIRIPALLETPAAIRFLSCEPLLGPVELGEYLAGSQDCPTCDGAGSVAVPGGGAACPTCGYDGRHRQGPSDLHWVIVGGESGPSSRPMDALWAERIRDECARAGVAYHFKQAGEVLAREWGCVSRKGGDASEWPVSFPREYPDAVNA